MTGGVNRWAIISYVLFKGVVGLVIIFILIHYFIGTIMVVSGESMEPNFETGQYVYINKLSFLVREPQRGEVIALRFPGDPDNKKFIKRLIGLPGEKLEIKDNKIFINGEELIESYLSPRFLSDFEKSQAIELAEDEYFLMGDNRAGSHDSRIWGPAEKKDLIGKASSTIFPLAEIKTILTPAY